jgi:rubrerythrin
VLEIVRCAEEGAAVFYDRAAATASDAGLRQVYEALAAWEREHAEGVAHLLTLAPQR